MTTPPTPQDVREIAAVPLLRALHDLNVQIPGLPAGCHCNLVAEVALDAALPAVEPVIRQQVGEEIAQAIHDRFDHLHPEWHSNMIAVADWCEDEARRHSTQPGEETTDVHR